jgi:hypothetical protein
MQPNQSLPSELNCSFPYSRRTARLRMIAGAASRAGLGEVTGCSVPCVIEELAFS